MTAQTQTASGTAAPAGRARIIAIRVWDPAWITPKKMAVAKRSVKPNRFPLS